MTTMLVPDYLGQFVCDGQRCPDNCCQGTWKIYVDEPHYKRLKKETDPEIREVVEQYFKRNRSNPTKETFAKLLLDKTKQQCAFLTDEKRCQLQMRLGAEALPNVCMTYPRITNRIQGQSLERSLSLSCPLAAELVLLAPEGWEFSEQEIDLHGRELYGGQIDLYDRQGKRPELEYFNQLRNFSVQILRTRDLPLWQRVVILGMFLEKVQTALDLDEVHEIPGLIERYTQMIVNGVFDEVLNTIPPKPEIQSRLTHCIAGKRIMKGVEPGFLAVVNRAVQGLGSRGLFTAELDFAAYETAFEQWYRPFFETREYILENYLVNHVFSTLFPLNRKTVFDSYAMLVVHYASLKMLLIGNAAYFKKLFDETHCVDVFQKYSKAVEHTPSFVNEVYEAFKSEGWISMAHMTILIRN